MGHDISARLNFDNIIATLRIPAIERYGADLFYNAINQTLHDKAVSGDNSFEFFTIPEIETALQKLDYLYKEDYNTFEDKAKKDESISIINNNITKTLQLLNSEHPDVNFTEQQRANIKIIGEVSDEQRLSENEKYYEKIKNFLTEIINIHQESGKDNLVIIQFA